jgi:hypothetical protein
VITSCILEVGVEIKATKNWKTFCLIISIVVALRTAVYEVRCITCENEDGWRRRKSSLIKIQEM